MTIEAIMIDGTLHTRPALFAGHPGNFVVALLACELVGPHAKNKDFDAGREHGKARDGNTENITQTQM